MSERHHRCMHLGPYSLDHVIIFHDIQEGVYAFHVIEIHQLTLGFIQDPKMSIFKLPRNRQCLVAIYAADSSGNLSFEVKLLPDAGAAATTTAQIQGTSSSSSSNYCYHQGCEPYQLSCPPGEVPACEQREVEEGGVTTAKTVMHCITPSSSSSSSSSATP